MQEESSIDQIPRKLHKELMRVHNTALLLRYDKEILYLENELEISNQLLKTINKSVGEKSNVNLGKSIGDSLIRGSYLNTNFNKVQIKKSIEQDKKELKSGMKNIKDYIEKLHTDKEVGLFYQEIKNSKTSKPVDLLCTRIIFLLYQELKSANKVHSYLLKHTAILEDLSPIPSIRSISNRVRNYKKKYHTYFESIHD